MHRQDSAVLQKPCGAPACEAEATPGASRALPPPDIVTGSAQGGRARRVPGEDEELCLEEEKRMRLARLPRDG